MTYSTRLISAVAVFAVALGLGLAAWRELAADLTSRANEAPIVSLSSLEMADLEGKVRTVGSLQGEWTVLNFWATWCAPCVEEMPELQRIESEYSSRGVVVLGLGIDNVTAMRRFKDEYRIRFPLLAAGSGGSELARQLGNASGALPFTVLVDRNGRVLQRKLGRISETELRRWLSKYLPPTG